MNFLWALVVNGIEQIGNGKKTLRKEKRCDQEMMEDRFELKLQGPTSSVS